MSFSRALVLPCLLWVAAPVAAQPGLVTSFVKVETGMTLQDVVQGDPKGPVVVLLFARDFQTGTAITPLPPAFLETMIAEVQRVPAAMFHELAKIKAKTLLLWGEKDAMFSKKDQDSRFARDLSGFMTK